MDTNKPNSTIKSHIANPVVHNADSNSASTKRYTQNKKISSSKVKSQLNHQDTVVCCKNIFEQQQIIAFIEKQHDPKSVVVVDSNFDIDNNDLLKTINCDKQNKLNITEGRLFSDAPLHLIIDISQMSAGEIARYNDLLSTPPTYFGKPLSKNIHRIVIINEKMLNNRANGPAADCWRRLAKLKFCESPQILGTASILTSFSKAKKPLSLKESISSKIPADISTTTIIDFATNNSWRGLLFGDFTLDDKGKIFFNKGRLANINANSQLVLKNAPWDDSEFVSTLESVLRQGGFRANANWVPLPKNLAFYQQNTSTVELNQLKDELVINSTTIENLDLTNKKTVTINSENLEDILVNTQLSAGVMYSKDTLAELIANSEQVIITNKLSKYQWLQLLTRIANSGNRPTIIDCSNDELIDTSENQQVKCQIYEHQATAFEFYQQRGYKLYQVSATTNLIKLCQDVSLESQNNFIFQQQDSEFLTDLLQGVPIVLYGLEENFKLRAQLETLFLKPSYLFLNGKKVILENPKLTILYPAADKKQKHTSIWQNNLQQAEVITKPTSYFDRSFADELLAMLDDFTSPLHAKYIPFKQQNFADIFAKQLKIEAELDQAETFLPVHYRKAAHSLIAKYYRDQPEIYGYLKTQINILKPDNSEKTVEANGIKQWLKQHPQVNKTIIEKNFWQLARYCSPACFKENRCDLRYLNFEFYKLSSNNEEVKILAEILATLADSKTAKKIKTEFNLEFDKKAKQELISRIKNTDNQEVKKILTQRLAKLDPATNYIFYNVNLKTQIYDALLTFNMQLKYSEPLSEIAKKLSVTVAEIISLKSNDNIAILDIYDLLEMVFVDTVSYENQEKIAQLAHQLVLGTPNLESKHQRRLKRLLAKTQQHPLIFLQGEAGTGKSHIAKAVASELQKDISLNIPEPLVISLGPQTTAEDLYGAQRLKPKSITDNYTEFVNGPILQWATNNNPPLLIIDEANLSQGLLAPLAGIAKNPKQLVFAGKIYPLTDKHRIILTGNPESYDGRSMDKAIKDAMLTVHYHPMTMDYLTEIIIEPNLISSWNTEQQQQATAAILSLYQLYKTNFQLNLGPRDLQDILVRIQTAIARVTNHEEITREQINHLVWQCFQEALLGRIKIEQQQLLPKLTNEYNNSFPQDASILNQREQSFQKFLAEIKQQNPNLDITTKPVEDLVHNYWLFLNNQQSEKVCRRGLWVEGPAGWGKDVILDAVLTLWQQQHPEENKFIHINANPNQWDSIVEAVTTAMANGQKLVISEINLLPSRYLEGLFNDILTKPANTGFALFATVNPSSFANREVLSSAFMSRMTQVKLANLSFEQLKSILSARFTNNKLVAWLLVNYDILASKLEQQKSPITITLDDLLTTANDMQNTQTDKWSLIFKSNFGLAMQSAQIKLIDLFLDINSAITAFKIKNKKVIHSSSGKIPKIFTANGITDKVSFSAKQYFADYDVDKYRLQISTTALENGEIVLEKLKFNDTDIEIINPPILDTNKEIKLKTDEFLASNLFNLSKDSWLALPGISYADECLGIKASENILLVRNKATGQLMVKLKDNIKSQQVEITFIIKAKLLDIAQEKVETNLQPLQIDPELKKLLADNIFHPQATRYKSCQELQTINSLADPKLKLQRLIDWARNFSYEQNATSPKSTDAFIEVIQKQIGTCYHRSVAFQALAEYMGIATNVISNATHAFVECSLDNKKSWISIDLGGAPAAAETKLNKPNFPKYSVEKEPEISNISDTLVEVQPIQNSVDFFDANGNIKADKLIDFLKYEFPFTQYRYRYEEIEESITQHFLNNTNDILLSLPEIFNTWLQKVLSIKLFYNEAVNFIITSIIKIYDICRHNNNFNNRQPLFLIALGGSLKTIEMLAIESNLLPVLEYLKQFPLYSEQATTMLSKFYQRITENQQEQVKVVLNNPSEYEIKVHMPSKLSGNSKTFLNSLQRVSLKKNWSYTNTGKAPNLARLASKRAAFAFSEDSKNNKRPTFIQLSSGDNISYKLKKVFSDFINNKENFSKIESDFHNFKFKMNVSLLHMETNIIVSAFISWVIKNCDDCTILIDSSCLIGDSIAVKMTYPGYSKVDDIFSCEEYAAVWLHSTYDKDREIEIEYNSDNLRTAFNQPNAVLLTADFLATCFEEYLQTIDWKNLYGAHSYSDT